MLHNIQLIVEAIDMSHMGTALAWRAMPIIPWHRGHYLPNRGTADLPVTEISSSVQNPRFVGSRVI